MQAAQPRLELQEAQDGCRDAELRVHELEKLAVEYRGQSQAIESFKEQISVAKRKVLDDQVLHGQKSRASRRLRGCRRSFWLMKTDSRLSSPCAFPAHQCRQPPLLLGGTHGLRVRFQLWRAWVFTSHFVPAWGGILLVPRCMPGEDPCPSISQKGSWAW